MEKTDRAFQRGLSPFLEIRCGQGVREDSEKEAPTPPQEGRKPRRDVTV